MMRDAGEDEAERADEWYDMLEARNELRELMQQQSFDRTVRSAKQKYATAKAAKTGATCECPSCGKEFIKKSYQQAFCSNKGQGNCKDLFWNTTDSTRRQRVADYYNKI